VDFHGWPWPARAQVHCPCPDRPGWCAIGRPTGLDRSARPPACSRTRPGAEVRDGRARALRVLGDGSVTFAIHDDASRCRELGEEISIPMETAGPEHVFEAETEAEGDPFVPFILPLASKALPAIGLAVVPIIRRMPPDAGRAIGSAAGSLLLGPSGKADGRASPTARRARGRQTALRLVRQLHKLLARGASSAPNDRAPRHYARAPASRRGQLAESEAMSAHRRAADDLPILAGTDRLARRDARLSDPRPGRRATCFLVSPRTRRRVCHTWL